MWVDSNIWRNKEKINEGRKVRKTKGLHVNPNRTSKSEGHHFNTLSGISSVCPSSLWQWREQLGQAVNRLWWCAVLLSNWVNHSTYLRWFGYRLLGRRPLVRRMSAGSAGEMSGFLDVKVPARVRRRRGLAPWKVRNTCADQPFRAQWELYVPPALTISNCAFCIYGFCMILTINIDYFLKRR
jgi:hypothetical protein